MCKYITISPLGIRFLKKGGEYIYVQNKYIIPIIVGLVLIVLAVGAMKLKGNKTSMANIGEQPANTQTNTTDESMAFDDSEGIAPSNMVEETPAGSDDAMDLSVITVEGANFTFNPNTITVKKGEKVRINFKNIEGFHDFVIDELNVKTAQLQADGEEMVEFTPMETGEFEFYCSVGKHREMGMKGMLIVE